jgi:hypothetical protein
MNRAEEMQELFARWKSSSQSLMAFGKAEGVPYSQLMYWRRKLDGKAARRKSLSAKAAARPDLVPVQIVADPAPATRPAPFEVWLANGVSLNVTIGFDEAELRRLVGVLSGC